MTPNIKKLTRQTLLYGIMVFIICTLSYLYIDRTLILIINEKLQHTLWIKLSDILSTVFRPNNWFILSFLLALLSIGQKIYSKTNTYCIIWVISLLIAIWFATIIKVIVARYRPELFLEYGLYGFHWFSHKQLFNSFPSGHVTITFAGSLALIPYLIQHKGVNMLCILMAIIITISRVVNKQHYLSDVLAGVYIGIFSYLWAKELVFNFGKLRINHTT